MAAITLTPLQAKRLSRLIQGHDNKQGTPCACLITKVYDMIKGGHSIPEIEMATQTSKYYIKKIRDGEYNDKINAHCDCGGAFHE